MNFDFNAHVSGKSQREITSNNVVTIDYQIMVESDRPDGSPNIYMPSYYITVSREAYDQANTGDRLRVVMASLLGREELLSRLTDIIKRSNVENADSLIADLERRLA